MKGGEGREMGMKERGKRKGCAGSKEKKRDQGKRRGTWEGIKR